MLWKQLGQRFKQAMLRARGLLVTGTDTGVGKTWVAAGLAAWCCSKGIDAGVMKPFATGAGRAGRKLVSEDALFLKQISGAQDGLELINPVCFKEPLAPWVAAKRARQPISMARVFKACRLLASRHDFMIIEGVGGLLVPLTERETVREFAKQLGLPVVIVARPGLGTINHTLLTIAAARQAGLAVAGVIINHAAPLPKDPEALLSICTNPAAIAKQGKVPIAGILPYQSKRTTRALEYWIDQYMNKQWLHRWLL